MRLDARVLKYMYLYTYSYVYIYMYMRPRLRSVAHAAFIGFAGVISLEISRKVARALSRRDFLVIRRQLPVRSNLLSTRIRASAGVRARARLCLCVQGDTINPERSPSRSAQINQGSGRVYTRHHRSEYKTPYGIYLTI